MNNMHIIRRVGTTPTQRGSATGANCPDVLKIEGGYLVIGKVEWPGTDVNKILDEHGAKIGTDEMAVIVPDQCMHDAARDIVQNYAKDNA